MPNPTSAQTHNPDRRIRELEALHAVASSVSRCLDLDEVMREALGQILAATGADAGGLYLLEPESGDLVLAAAQGSEDAFTATPEGRRIPAGTAWWHPMTQDGQPVVAEGICPVLPLPDGPPDREVRPSVACVPLRARERIEGHIILVSHTPGLFQADDLMLLAEMVEQVGVALQNARLFRQQEEQLMTLQTLQEVSQTIRGSLDLDEALDRILAGLRRVVSYDSAAVWLRDRDRIRALAFRKSGDVAPEVEVTLPANDSLFQEVERTRQPLVLPDAQADPRFQAVGDTRYVHGWVLAPLTVRDRVIGCLTVDSAQVAAYDDDDAQTVMAFARHAALTLENARLYEQSRHQVKALEALHEISIELLSWRRIEDLLRDIVHRASELVGAAGGGIYLYDSETEQLTISISLGIAEKFIGRTLRTGEGLAGRVIRTGEPMWTNDYMAWEGRPGRFRDAPFRASISVPLMYKGRILGALSLAHDQPGHTFDDADARILKLLAAQAAVAMENARLYEDLQRLADHDGLTGLYNHRHFHDLLEQEVARARRYGHPLALLFIDLDGFKNYNDCHGHVAGDEALRQIAALLAEGSRKGDLLARYGGEEFAVILPETARQKAIQVAERIRLIVEERTRSAPFLSAVTASVGVASHPEDAGSASRLVLTADAMLYQAKARGKNQVAAQAGSEPHPRPVDEGA